MVKCFDSVLILTFCSCVFFHSHVVQNRRWPHHFQPRLEALATIVRQQCPRPTRSSDQSLWNFNNKKRYLMNSSNLAIYFNWGRACVYGSLTCNAQNKCNQKKLHCFKLFYFFSYSIIFVVGLFCYFAKYYLLFFV